MKTAATPFSSPSTLVLLQVIKISLVGFHLLHIPILSAAVCEALSNSCMQRRERPRATYFVHTHHITPVPCMDGRRRRESFEMNCPTTCILSIVLHLNLRYYYFSLVKVIRTIRDTSSQWVFQPMTHLTSSTYYTNPHTIPLVRKITVLYHTGRYKIKLPTLTSSRSRR
jgi:hypothetical protein